MVKTHLRMVLLVVMIMALFSIVLTGGLAGCEKKNTSTDETNDVQDDVNEQTGGGPSGIAFVRDSYKICIVNENGSSERQFTNDPSCAYGNLAFSPSGKKLAATKTQGDSMPDLVIIDLAGGKETSLYFNSTNNANWNAVGVPWFGTLSWASEDVLYLTTTESGHDTYQVARFTFSTNKVELIIKDAKSPSVTPDGKKLAYIGLPANWAEESGGTWVTPSPGDLMIRDLTSGDTKLVYVHFQEQPSGVFEASRGFVYDVAFAPDGKHLVTTCADGPDTELYYIDVKGEVVATPAMIGTAGRLGSPSFSPDGKKVVYHVESWQGLYDSPHDYEINTVQANAPMSPSTRVSLGKGRNPAWGPPGTGQ